MLFAVYLSDQGLSWQTIKSYLAAVRHLHVLQGSPFPGLDGPLPRLQLLLRGVKRVTSKDHPTRARLPITPQILRRIRDHLFTLPCTWDRRMLWAAMNICFFGFLRSGEICCPTSSTFDDSEHLTLNEVSLDSHMAPSRLFLRIKASKTDPFRAGVTIVVGATGQDLCPVLATVPFLSLRGARAGPLFLFADGSFLTRARFVQEVRSLLTAIGVNAATYSGHSFRIGAATTAAQAGVESHVIQTMGRWSSSAYLAYIRLPRDTLSGVSAQLASQ